MDEQKKNALIRLSQSYIGTDEKQAVLAVLDKGYLGMGEEVQAFERALTDYFKRESVCVINGTAALHLALQACGVGKGDEVLVPSLTYIASFQAISATGATPVACDIDQNTLTLDLKDAERRLTKKTKAIMTVHYSGGVGELDDIYQFARGYNLRLIEDAAHALGTVYKDERVGARGDIVCFSFDGIKNITSGEGGAIVTKDENILQQIKDARLLGIENDSIRRFNAQRSWEFDVTNQGWRYHMSNIMAAIGLIQLQRLESMLEIRRARAKLYDQLLKNNEHVYVLPHDYNIVAPHIYVVRIKGLKDRNILREKLLHAGIQTGIHYQPNHQLTFYHKKNSLSLPNTNTIFPEILSLPLHCYLTQDDVAKVSDLLLSNLMSHISC